MLESQVRATDSHVNGEEENKYAKKNYEITGDCKMEKKRTG